MTIDNIWTYYQKPGAKRSEGGITAHLRNSKNTKIQLRLKGDNRVGNIHYGALKDYNNQIVFSNGENENQAPGSITVADFPNDFKKNRWCSAIGGDDDNCDRSDGIVIDSGVIYAGTTSGDDCTAIGGGGNEYGGVTINGGIITAVSASTGTAIGGGIGWSSQGGNANVTINNGTVYAYNHGIGPDSGSYVGFVPAAAIGGGSASTNKGNESTIVTINGGTVYAQSMAGAAIGGGGSGTMDGGSATVNIKGGTVIAKSVGGEVKYNKDNNVNHSETVTAGASIGGGTGKTAGGTVTLNISEDNGKKTILRTGSIGGGLATQEEKPVGSANVTVTGGDIWLKGGSISHNTAKNGGGAYVGGNYNMIAGKVMSNEAANSGGGIYVNDGTVTMYGGNVDSNTADESGGGMYISSDTKEALVDIFSGSISGNKSKNSGGGVSVVSPSDKHIDVTVGVNCEHPKLPDGNYNPFDYPEDAGKCGKAHIDHNNHVDNIDGNKLQHSSCPQVKNNTATNNGGGFFLNSSNSDITIYCLEAQGNEATNDPDSYCMDVRGGKLQIGDEDFDIHIDHALSGAKGNTIIYGSIMVEGGQVDLYGEMENPKFMQDVKVDVTKEEDHYVDHRIIETGHHDYKVHYYENFKGDGDTPTGLYIARQYPDEEHADAPEAEKYKFTVMSSIFSRPGYKIVGWNEKPDDSGDKYEVNETYDLEKLKDDGKVGVYITADGEKHFDEYLLVLYAIWERSGYMLKFDPNVGEGETYTGTMKNQSVTVGLLDGSQTIEKNQFERPGYEFMGWTLTPTPSDADEVYKDGQPIEEDFTDEDGATVTLYAKWKRCDHDGFLTYTEDENILTQTCSKCGGHTATATLSAVDSTYDQKEHLATADFSENWIGDKPEISYEMAKNDTWDSEDSIDDDWNAATNPKPVHAGTYTAKITGKNETDNKEATAQVKYTISPVKWETPKTPQILFKVEKVDGVDKSIIEISEPIGDNIEYMIKRLDNGKIEDIPGHEGWLNYKEFSDIPFGYYYYFYAKMCADRDHLESEPSKSDAYLANGGNIVYIKNATGIKVVPDIGGGSFKYTVSADKGYHLRNYEYKESQAEIPGASGAKNEEGITISHSGPSDGEYKYEVNFKTGKVAYWQVTLEFSGAAKNASVSHKVTDGQVFRNFNNKATSISRDSAFTARFTVSDYIPDEYEAQVLGFSESLPKGTTVIMKTGGQYWHYELNEERSAIDLTDFTAMGGKGKFSFDKEGNSPETFTYQFIVDFSQSTGANITADIEVNLKLTAASPQNSASQSAPTVPETGEKHISLGIKEKAAFKLDLTSVFGKSATLKCDYTPSDGAASIWNDRQTALVLTATATSEVPADLTLTTVVDEKTVLYSMNSKKQFIIPLGKIGDSEVKTTLNSCLFGTAGKNLEFTAEWYVSKSNADKSPLNGYKAATCDKNINFSGTKDALPSVRIDDADRVCKPGGTLKIDVNYAGIPKGDEITAHLQSKTTDGQYDYTGANIKIPHDTNTNGKESIQFSMGKMDKGSYRILVIVQESGANILQVPYYFVIE